QGPRTQLRQEVRSGRDRVTMTRSRPAASGRQHTPVPRGRIGHLGGREDSTPEVRGTLVEVGLVGQVVTQAAEELHHLADVERVVAAALTQGGRARVVAPLTDAELLPVRGRE